MNALNKTIIIVIAKEPRPGKVKTRLISALGEEGAARLAHAMLDRAISSARAVANQNDNTRVLLAVSPSAERPFWKTYTDQGVYSVSQVDGDLGQRMYAAVEQGIQLGAEKVLLMGMDCPALDSCNLQKAIDVLDSQQGVMIPTADGGYALLGLKNTSAPFLFSDIPWSTSKVAALTRECAAAHGLAMASMPGLVDIDEPADLALLPPDLCRVVSDGLDRSQ